MQESHPENHCFPRRTTPVPAASLVGAGPAPNNRRMSSSIALPAAFPRSVRVEWLLLLVAAIWGGSYSAAKVATEQVPVLQFLFLRFGLTFVLLLPALRGLAVPGWRAALALLGRGRTAPGRALHHERRGAPRLDAARDGRLAEPLLLENG